MMGYHYCLERATFRKQVTLHAARDRSGWGRGIDVVSSLTGYSQTTKMTFRNLAMKYEQDLIGLEAV